MIRKRHGARIQLLHSYSSHLRVRALHLALPITVALILLTVAAGEVSAQQTDWTNPTIGNWFISSNWNAGVPQSGSIAEVNNGGAPIIDSAGAVADFLYIGELCADSGSLFVRGNGRLTLGAWLNVYHGTFEVNSGGHVTVLNDPHIGGTTVIGHCGNTGTVRVTDPGSYLTTPDLEMPGNGETGTGILRIENGGRVDSTSANIYTQSSAATVTGSNSIWAIAGVLTAGNVTISSGGTLNAVAVAMRFGVITVTGSGSALNTMVSSGDTSLLVGESGPATLSMQSGGKATSNNAVFGEGDSTFVATGTVFVAGNGSSWTNQGTLYLGGSYRSTSAFGTGAVNVSSGGLLTTGPSSAGYTSPSTGNVSVTGPNSKWNNSGDLIFGLSGTGTLSIQSGGAVSSAGFANVRGYLGFNNGASGSATVTGAGSSWTTTGSLWVGNAGSGFLNVSSGGKVITGGNGYIGAAASASSSAIVSGAGSTWDTAGPIYVGGDAAGAGGGGFGSDLQIADGASVNASAITLYNTGTLTLVNNTTCTGPLTSIGGGIRTFGNTALTNNITLGSGGLSVTNQTAGTTSVLSGNLTGSGGLTKFGFSTIGLGTLILTGTNDYSGATTINRGTLLVNGSITSPTTVNNGGTLGGSGTVGAVTVNNGGTVAPGNSPGILTINGNYNQTSAGTLAIELGGYTPGTQFDQLAVSGQATVDGTLNVSRINNFHLNVGDTFQIITSKGEIGNFSTINSTGFTVTSEASETGIVLTVVAVDPPITVTTTDDHDDGTCDAADCTLREAIKAANTRVGDDDIFFAPDVTGTIQLGSALPLLTSNIALQGPGADVLTVRRNTAPSYNIFTTAPGAVVSISGLTITNGRAASGGGIFNDHGLLTVVNCVVTGNTATGSSGGGGIYNQGANGAATLIMDSCTISGNSAAGQLGVGGGIFSNGQSSGNAVIDLSNCTISGNTANQSTAAIQNFGATGQASATLTNCTVTGTTTTNSATLILANSIFASSSGANFTVAGASVITSQGHNLSSDAAGGNSGTSPGGYLNGPGDIRNTNPQLDPAGLANNGGSTMTIALQSTSPAIDGGDDNLAPIIDQRGYPRFGVSDVGAFELQGTLPPVPLVSIVSRKFHGSSGPFEIDLLEGSPSVECRAGGAAGDHTIVFTFANPLTSVGSVALTGTGKVSNSEIGSDAREYIVSLTGVANAQTISVSLTNVTDSLGNQSDIVTVAMGVLLGDTTGNGDVNASDVSLTKLKSGEPIDASNFRADVTANGVINSSDVSNVKLRSGTALPP